MHAVNLDFSVHTIRASAGQSVTITLQNADAGVPHDLGLLGSRTSSCAGPCSSAISFTAPAPGSYPFACSYHPYMAGTLEVRP